MYYIDNTIIQHTSVIKLHTQNAVKICLRYHEVDINIINWYISIIDIIDLIIFGKV